MTTDCGHNGCKPEGPCFWREDRMPAYQTKDSGKREEYASGMVRDTEEGKARFDLLHPKGVPYANQMLTRFAELMGRGAKKYGDRNWELAQGQEELDRYHSSAMRHLEQWAAGETDEDHAAAVMFNVLAGETVKYKMRRPMEAMDERPLCYSKWNDGESVHECTLAEGHKGRHSTYSGFSLVLWGEGRDVC